MASILGVFPVLYWSLMMRLGLASQWGWTGARRSGGVRGKPSGRRQTRLLFETLEPRRILAGVGPLLISEFMAVNNGALADKDGEYSDWIEIHNPTANAVDLGGWHLTDDQDDLDRWDFPAVTLDSKGYMVVFASGKNLRDPASELHTNFKLSGDGEYLALVHPNGATVSHAYTPQFPSQQTDVSYGLSQGVTESQWIGPGAPVKAWVPANGTMGSTWTQAGFNDSTWTSGTTGVGYDVGTDYDSLIGTGVQSWMYGVNSSVYTRVPFNVSDPAAVDSLRLRMQYDDGFMAYLNGTPVAQRNSPTIPNWRSTATSEHGLAETSYLTQDFDGGGTAYASSIYSSGPVPLVMPAGPDGNFLRLVHDNALYNYNRVSFDRVLEGPSSHVTADFNFRLYSPTNPDYPADGFAFLLLPTSMYGTTGPGSDGSYVSEEPNLPNTFAIGFDAYPEDWGVNDVSAHWNGTEFSNVTLSNADLDLDAGVFHHAHVQLLEVEGGMQVTVTLTPDIYGNPGTPVTPIADLFIPGMRPYESRAEFSGRTGGLYMNVDLDEISVKFEPAVTTLPFEDFDISQYRELLVAGANVLAVHGMNLRSTDDDLLIVPQLTAVANSPIQAQVETYFANPTPGSANLTAEDAPAEPPVFSRDSGTFASPFSLTLSAASPFATIRYTTDGSIPTETSTPYTAPLFISSTTRIRAGVFQDGFSPSPVVSRGFIALDSTVADFDSDLPLIVFDTYGVGLGDTLLTPATAVFIEPEPGGRAEIAAAPSFAGRSGLRIRGQSSQGFPKKSYALEIWAEGGTDVTMVAADYAADFSVSLLGLPEESDWVLHGPFSDKALLRNYLAYTWSNAIGQYAPRTQLVEVFVNTDGGALDYADDYVGVYVFMEKIKLDPNRVDVEELGTGDNSLPEVTGGYIYKKDKDGAGDRPWTTAYGQTLRHVSPEADEITPQQQAYLETYINQFEAALYAQTFTDPEVGYAQYIDADSFIDNWIVVEMCKNIDGFRLSTYYHKDRDGKIQMGPVWDYDLSLGNADYLEGGIATGWYSDQLGDYDYPYWRRLFQDPDFEQRLVDRWSEYRCGTFATNSLLGDVDAAAATINEAQARNFQKWDILGQYVWPNYYVAASWQDEIAWTKQWLQDRVEWMDSQFVAPPQITPDGSGLGRGTPVTIAAPAGTIYYTLDGSDPRAAGGGLSPSAQEYTGPISLTATTLVRARALDATSAFEWSPLAETPYHMDPPPVAGDLSIVEIQYHPTDPMPGELAGNPNFTDSDFEFIEVLNTSGHAVSLLGCRFSEGIDFTFDVTSPTSLGPGQRVVVAANPAALAARYGSVAGMAGPFESGSLDNSGQSLRLVNFAGADLVAFVYEASGAWPGRADGNGSSLELIDTFGDPGDGANWRSSTEYGGSPGYAGIGPMVDVVVNEVLSHTDPPDVDAIELYNTTGASINIGYWWLSDADADYFKFQVPAGTVLPAHGYLIFDENDFNSSGGADPGDFALNGAHGDEVWLLAGNSQGKLTRFVDHVTFPPQSNGESFGRWPDGAGDLYPMVSPTLGSVNANPRIGAVNSGPRVGPIVVSELNYNPQPGGFEFIELYNASSMDVPLYDPANPAHGWLFDGVNFVFPAGTVLPHHGVALVVGADPALFRATYDVPADVPVFGPFSGALNNGGERLQLLYPDEPPADEPTFVPYLLGDEVRYDNEAPWPVTPDGTGQALHRASPTAWGNDATNWHAGPPTPGLMTDAPADVVPVSVVFSGGADVILSYEIRGGAVAPFEFGFYRSSDTAFGGDLSLDSILIDASADRTLGMHAKTLTLGVGQGQIALPGAGAGEIDTDYFLLVVVDPQNGLNESLTGGETNNTQVMTGVYHAAGGPVMVQGLSTKDAIQVQPTTGPETVQVAVNGTTRRYAATDVTGVRVRAHNGGDEFQLRIDSGFGSSATLVFLFDGGTGTNTAKVWGSTSTTTKDVARINPMTASLVGPRYTLSLAGMRGMTVTSQGGPDEAYIYDSSLDDTLTAYPEYVTLSNSLYTNRAEGFRNVFAYAQVGGAYASAGGSDVAYFHGLDGTRDYFRASAMYAIMADAETGRGMSYFVRGNWFEHVHAYGRTVNARPSGVDRDQAMLYDAASVDLFDADTANALAAYAFSGASTVNVHTFRAVKAYGAPGDIANLYGPGTYSTASNPVMYTADYTVWANGFAPINWYPDGRPATSPSRTAVDAAWSLFGSEEPSKPFAKKRDPRAIDLALADNA